MLPVHYTSTSSNPQPSDDKLPTDNNKLPANNISPSSDVLPSDGGSSSEGEVDHANKTSFKHTRAKLMGHVWKLFFLPFNDTVDLTKKNPEELA